jgi:hypothetical protein
VRKILQSLLGLLPTPKSVVGLVGYFLVALYPISLVLNFLSNADLVAANVERIEHILNQWWGYPLFMILGFAVLLYAGYKQQSRQTLQTVEHRQPETQPTTTTEHDEDVEQLRAKLRKVEHERDEFKAENEVLSKQLAAAQTQPRSEQQPASSNQPFSLEPVKRRGPQKPNGERDIYMSIRLTNEGSGSIQGCRGRLMKVQDMVSTPDGHEWRDFPHIHTAHLRWSPGDGGSDSADFTTEAILDVAAIESWEKPVYQLLTANESLRSTYRLQYGWPGPILTIEISAQSGGRIEQIFYLEGHHRDFLEAPTEVEPVVTWRKWP